MAVKSYWSFEPGESIVAEELVNRKKEFDFYFPLKDKGIDILGVHKKTKRVITFQVKESRYYEKSKSDHSWHQEDKHKIIRNKEKVDYYVFVTYIPSHLSKEKQKKPHFDIKFIIVPMKELLEKIKNKRPNKAGKYSFYFSYNRQERKVIEVREKDKIWENNKLFDYTKYSDNNGWDKIK